ncbi:MAG: phenylalanine--tRNA ligase subunit alpha, partial [Rhodospirillales bacterium]|nr:phenylalanine--tRNA ligase subunit alpha [Rhodospirillales bacterium]
MDNHDQLRSDLLSRIADADLGGLEELRVKALGRKGAISEMMSGLGALPGDQRKAAGQALNALKNEIAAAIDARHAVLSSAGLEARLATETIDITLPARPHADGRIHPISQTIDEMVAIFCEMG